MLYKIDMIPVAKGRPRVTKKGITYTPQKTKNAEEFIAAQIKNLGIEPFPKDVALELGISFYMPKPKGCERKHHTVKPDLDNLVKLFMDGCKAIFNDKQVIYINAEKLYIIDDFIPDPCITFDIKEIGGRE